MKLIFLSQIFFLFCICSQAQVLDEIKQSASSLRDLISTLARDPTEIVEAASKRLCKVNEIECNFELIFEEDRYYLKAKNEIEANTTILQFDDKECFSTQIMKSDYFEQVSNPEKLTSDFQAFKDLKAAVWQKGILAFLYHLYNMKQSKYYAWILTIPKETPSLLNHISQIQIDLLSDDKLQEEIIQYSKTLKGDFLALQEQMNNDWTTSQKLSFFNNNEFTLGDYYYGRHILELCGFCRKSVNDQSFFVIPSFMYIPMGKEFNPEIRPTKVFMDRPTQSLHLAVQTDSKIAKGEIIKINIQRKEEELYFYIALGALKEQGSTICTDIKLADFEEIYKENQEINSQKIELIKHLSNFDGVACLTANKFSSLIFTQIQNILNMNPQQTSDCYNKALSPSSQIYDEKQIKFQLQQIEEICEKPKQITNKLDFILQQLDSKQQFVETKMQEMELQGQNQNSKSLLISYFKLQKYMILQFKQQIQHIITEKKNEL